jgi:hypothetical protein
LEGDAEIDAIAAARLDLRLAALGEGRPDLASGGEQRRRLGADHREIGVLGRGGVLGRRKLHHLALGDHRRRGRQHVQASERPDFDHHLEGLAEQEIADQHARLVAPHHARGHLAAAKIAFVDDVVEQQRRRMHELDRGGELDVAVAAIAAQARRGEREDRPETLAARGNQMIGDFGNHRHRRSRARQDRLVDQRHVAGHQRDQALDQPFRRLFLERNDNSHGRLPCQSAGRRP